MVDPLAREMYKEHILDLYKNPHNFGELKEVTHQHREHNPLCGDDLTLQLKIKGRVIEEAKFIGRGCAISMAAASLLTDKLKGMSIEKVQELTYQDMIQMMEIPIGPVRIKCAVLALDATKKAIEE